MTDPNHFITELPTTDDEILAYANRIRLTQINKIMSTAQDVTDNKTQNTLDKLLGGLDRQIIGLKRLSAQEKFGAGMSDLANTLDTYFRTVNPENSSFKRHDGGEIEEGVFSGPANIQAISVQPSEFIEGQLTVSGTEVNIEKIMSEGRQRQRG